MLMSGKELGKEEHEGRVRHVCSEYPQAPGVLRVLEVSQRPVQLNRTQEAEAEQR